MVEETSARRLVPCIDLVPRAADALRNLGHLQGHPLLMSLETVDFRP
jgi:hypothetical protein